MRQFLANSLFEIAVRARKSPWIETDMLCWIRSDLCVRARKSPWIETCQITDLCRINPVRARKSPWIETLSGHNLFSIQLSGLVRARGLKLYIEWRAACARCQGS